jgi:hypothetical protein
MESDWRRPHYEPGGGNALVVFVVFGQMAQPLSVSAARHRTRQVPPGIELRNLDRAAAASFFDSPIQSGLLKAWYGVEIHELISAGCVLLRGEVTDPADLIYLRDSIGIVTALLESGGKAVLNLQSMLFFTPERWMTNIFEADKPYPRHHIHILHSADETARAEHLQWVHTRGLRLFGRPDISIRQVPEHGVSMADELCNRFIEMLAFGHVIPEGQAIHVAGVEGEIVCRHAGDLDDPNFNNVHVEIVWPRP